LKYLSLVVRHSDGLGCFTDVIDMWCQEIASWLVDWLSDDNKLSVHSQVPPFPLQGSLPTSTSEVVLA